MPRTMFIWVLNISKHGGSTASLGDPFQGSPALSWFQLANRNIPYHGCHAQHRNGGLLGDRNLWVAWSLFGDRLHNQSLGGEKNCIVCVTGLHFLYYYYYYFYYSSLFYLIKQSLCQAMSFTFCPFSSLYNCVGGEWVNSCMVWVVCCQHKPQHTLTIKKLFFCVQVVFSVFCFMPIAFWWMKNWT